MDYKALFFDWDGTLVEHSKLISEGHSFVRNHFGLDPYDQQAALSRGHQSTRELYPILYGDKWQEAEEIFYNFFFDNHLNDVNPFDDTKTLLDFARQLDMLMGVVSNKRQIFLTREIDHLGWNDYFKAIVGAGEAERDKPSSAPLQMALKNTCNSLNKDNILYIGDTETDMKCAADMGCDFALILRGRDMKDLIETYNPQYIFESFDEMLKTLEKTNTKKVEKKAC